MIFVKAIKFFLSNCKLHKVLKTILAFFFSIISAFENEVNGFLTLLF